MTVLYVLTSIVQPFVSFRLPLPGIMPFFSNIISGRVTEGKKDREIFYPLVYLPMPTTTKVGLDQSQRPGTPVRSPTLKNPSMWACHLLPPRCANRKSDQKCGEPGLEAGTMTWDVSIPRGNWIHCTTTLVPRHCFLFHSDTYAVTSCCGFNMHSPNS